MISLDSTVFDSVMRVLKDRVRRYPFKCDVLILGESLSPQQFETIKTVSNFEIHQCMLNELEQLLKKSLPITIVLVV